jgi:glycosyltransferase involved in cell wall biosynthesis
MFADDAEGFAQTVLSLFDDSARTAALGSAARRAAERRYGWAAIGDAMLDVYAKLAAHSHDNPGPRPEAALP